MQNSYVLVCILIALYFTIHLFNIFDDFSFSLKCMNSTVDQICASVMKGNPKKANEIHTRQTIKDKNRSMQHRGGRQRSRSSADQSSTSGGERKTPTLSSTEDATWQGKNNLRGRQARLTLLKQKVHVV